MSVPPQIMQQMMARLNGGAGGQAVPGGANPGGAPPSTGAAGMPGQGAPQQPPGGAPMSGPQEKKGLKAGAATNVHIAVNMLEEALPAFGSESPEGQKILKALSSLGSLVEKRDSSDLVPAEILQMVRRMPQMGGGTDVQRQIMQLMQQKQPPPQAA